VDLELLWLAGGARFSKPVDGRSSSWWSQLQQHHPHPLPLLCRNVPGEWKRSSWRCRFIGSALEGCSKLVDHRSVDWTCLRLGACHFYGTVHRRYTSGESNHIELELSVKQHRRWWQSCEIDFVFPFCECERMLYHSVCCCIESRRREGVLRECQQFRRTQLQCATSIDSLASSPHHHHR